MQMFMKVLLGLGRGWGLAGNFFVYKFTNTKNLELCKFSKNYQRATHFLMTAIY